MNATSSADNTVASVHSNTPLFSLGAIAATPAVLEHFDQHGTDLHAYIARHHHGDWGDLCIEDARANQQALQFGGRIFSAYIIASEKVWIITEADRSATTLLFPSEY